MLIADLPPLREVIRAYGLDAKKTLGQHFLLDLNLTAKIARGAGNLFGVHVVEIGPGPGGLTRALLDTNATRVIAVERDDRAVAALQGLVAASDGRLTVIGADALELDVTTIVPAPRAIVANLPYNVGTPLLFGWLEKIDQFEHLTLMFQKEVADRLVAQPRSKAYGRLSVMTQWRTTAKILFDLPAAAFTPPPKVASSVVRLVPKPVDDVPFGRMERIVAAAFGQRRKMLRQSLKSVTPHVESWLDAAGITPTARAEELDPDAFVRLARALPR
jgi:16S rRNA (adenine1518-N6/adenine1519-N6)-dimethyltransferase